MPRNRDNAKPRLGISACSLGERVRYDGGHKHDCFLTETFGRIVEWIPVCPELEVGMGVPREAVRLVGSSQEPRMIAERSGMDWTDAMNSFAAKRIDDLAALDLSGYVLKRTRRAAASSASGSMNRKLSRRAAVAAYSPPR